MVSGVLAAMLGWKSARKDLGEGSQAKLPASDDLRWISGTNSAGDIQIVMSRDNERIVQVSRDLRRRGYHIREGLIGTEELRALPFHLSAADIKSQE